MSRVGSFKRTLFIAGFAQAVAICIFSGLPVKAMSVLAPGDAQLSMSRVFAGPDTSDALQFSLPAQTATLVSDSVFGHSVSTELSTTNATRTRARLFGQVLDSSYSPYDQPGLHADETAAITGVQFRLFGGEQTLTLQTVGKNFGAAGLFNNPGPAPALFAFYNFPLASQLTDAAVVNPYPQVPLQNTTLQPLGTVSFPGLNAQQSPTGDIYDGLIPNSRGAAVQLRFPLVFSGIKANVRVNGESLGGIVPNSLATQIFGPAFASSVTGKYNSLAGGVTLALPLFDRKATVNLDGLYESLKRNDKSSFLYAANASYLANNPGVLPFDSAASASLDVISAPSALYFYPNFIDIHRFAGGASLAVPVTKRLTVNGGFSEQRYNGEALNTLTQDLSQGSRSISGGLVYNIPKTNSSIDLFFNRYQYFDDVVPASNRTVNRQNIYFSVKF